MKIGLAVKESINNDIIQNIKVIKETIADAYNKQLDLVCFGEAFLQGFDCLSWNYQIDKNIAISVDSTDINDLRNYAKEKSIALAFGYIEINYGAIFSSYIFIGRDGQIVDNYRRVSPGWKEPIADKNYYFEGERFQSFRYLGKTFTSALCGDLWNLENIEVIKEINSDIVLWPVYVNFSIDEWYNNQLKDYVFQVSPFDGDVFYINCLSKNPNAYGGAYHFRNNQVISCLPLGQDGILVVEI